MRHAFSLEKAKLWIEDCCCNQKQLIKIQNIMMKTNKDVNWWTGVVWIVCGLWWCFYQLFELILTAPIHCRASDVMLNFSKSVLMKKQTHLSRQPFNSIKQNVIFKMLFILRISFFKNCSLKACLGNQKWLFYCCFVFACCASWEHSMSKSLAKHILRH